MSKKSKVDSLMSTDTPRVSEGIQSAGYDIEDALQNPSHQSSTIVTEFDAAYGKVRKLPRGKMQE